jgi:indole-3-glycerol phosphate synthase
MAGGGAEARAPAMSALSRILASKREEVRRLREATASGKYQETSKLPARCPRGAREALARPRGTPLRLVCEVKLRSPSAGPLSHALSPAARALAYAAGGAAMVSVLCDAPFFDGSFSHLAEARSALDDAGLATPLLAKEFVLDEVQLDLARAHGADAVLLIARIVSTEELARLAEGARARGLEPLVEVVDEDEVARALAAGAQVIGVNARDLDTLSMDAARAARVLDRIPPHVVAVHLSGLKDATDVAAIASTRAEAALVGEALMRADDPRPLLAAMLESAARSAP